MCVRERERDKRKGWVGVIKEGGKQGEGEEENSTECTAACDSITASDI